MRFVPFILAVLMLFLHASFAGAETATYYAPHYAGGVTSTGDVYDPGAFTAAHPFLKGPALVCSVASGACIEVNINDTCGCGIDLSEAAFTALFDPAQGVGEVTVTPL